MKTIKKIISVICILALIISMAIVIENKMPEKEESATTPVTVPSQTASNIPTQTASNGETVPKVITDSNGMVKAILAPSQVCDSSELVLIEDTDVAGLKAIEMIISDATISRELKHNPAIEKDIEKTKHWLTNGSDKSLDVVYEEDIETFKEGVAFYVYFTITMKYLGNAEYTMYPGNIAMASIEHKDDKYVAMECIGFQSRPEYKKYGFFNYAAYFSFVDGIDYYVDGNMYNLYIYKYGESMTAEVILAVPEEDIKNDCIYIYYPYGKRFNRAAMDMDQRFIKLNLTNRGDYFE